MEHFWYLKFSSNLYLFIGEKNQSCTTYRIENIETKIKKNLKLNLEGSAENIYKNMEKIA